MIRLKICVVILTHNRVNDLRDLLIALHRQTQAPDEVVIISASEPKFQPAEKKLLDTYLNGVQNKKYKAVKIKNISYSRNLAFKLISSASHVIAFLDDDCIPKKDWIYNLHKYHTQFKKQMIIGGGYLQYHKDYLSQMYAEGARIDSECTYTHSFQAGNVSFKVRELKKTGLKFDTSISTSEDFEFSLQAYRKGYNVLLVRDLSVYHKFRKTLAEAVVRFFMYGRNDYYIHTRLNTAEKNFYLPGKKFRIIRFLLNLPKAYYFCFKDYVQRRRSLYFFPGYFLIETAKLFGLFTSLLSDELSGHQPKNGNTTLSPCL